jgi:hypothetical protein
VRSLCQIAAASAHRQAALATPDDDIVVLAHTPLRTSGLSVGGAGRLIVLPQERRDGGGPVAP